MRAVALVMAGGMLSACAGDLIFADENNYSYQSNIEIASVPIAAGVEPCFDWSGLTTDIRGRPFDGVVDEAYLTQMAQSQSETIERFEQNTFFATDVDEPYAINPESDASSACGEQFQVIGNFFDSDEFSPGEDWLVTLTEARNSPAGGFDPIMSLFVVPDEQTTNSQISITDDAMTLEITGLDIASAPRIPVSRGTNRADWNAVTVDVYGNAFTPQDGNDLFIARFDVETVAEIEDVFLTLDESAAEIYRFDAFGARSLQDLSLAVDENNQRFSGFSNDGIWVFGLACTRCNNPAPLLLSVLEVQ